MKRLLCSIAVIGALTTLPYQLMGAEYFMGDNVEKNGMNMSPAYLLGVMMDQHPKGMSEDPNSIHIELDIHASKNNMHGFPEDAWIPSLTVVLTMEKLDSKYKEEKELAQMQANDGPHYANDFAMDGVGKYRATYSISPPSSTGFIRHTDKETGVADWWKPFDVSWTFDYPSTEIEE